jgi:hypothetical protein
MPSRRVAAAVALVCCLLAVVASPPVLGLLAAVDGSVEPGPRRFLLWVVASVAAAWGLLAGLGAWLGDRYWLALRRSMTRIAVAVGAAAGIASWWVWHNWQHHQRPSWRAAVDLRHPALAQVARHVANGDADAAEAALVAHIQRRTLAPGPWALNAWIVHPELQRTAVAAARAGKLAMPGAPEVAWPEVGPAPWLALDGPLEFAAQRGEILLSLIHGWDEAKDPRLLTRIADLATNWPATAWALRTWPWPDPVAWGDDSGPNRTMALLDALDRLARAQVLDLERARRLLDLLVLHRQQLVEPEAWNDVTNHGLMQNAALLAFGLALPEFDPGHRLRDLGIDRQRAYWARAVSADGVSLELTPGYHCSVAYFLLWHAWRRQASGLKVPAGEAEQLRKMFAFAVEFRWPDGTMPIIADTLPGERCPSLVHWPAAWPAWPERTALTALPSPGRTAAVRTWTAGYGMLRTTGQGNPEPPLVATLMAGLASLAHQHFDKLSLSLFADGRPLLGSPGYASFFAADRDALRQTWAQSAVSIDGRSQRLGPAQWGFAAEVGTGWRLDAGLLQAQSELYDGVVHRRTLAFGADRRSVIVLDELTSDAPHTYAVHERALGEPTAVADGGALALRWTTAPVAELRVERMAWTDERVAKVGVQWRAPLATSSVTGRNVVIVSLLALAGGGRAPMLRPGQVEWRGPDGAWLLNLPLRKSADARFVPAADP